jgi:branched-chain amino acid transport system permease protein
MSMEVLVAQAIINGVVVGMLYLLMAVGFTLAFGVMRVVNFAHGEFYMLGAFAAYVAYAVLGLPFIAAVAIAFAAAVVLGGVVERVVLRPFRRDELSGMIATIGLAMILQNGALMIFGPNPLSMPAVVSGVTRLGPFVFPTARLYTIGLSLVILGLFFAFVRYSRTGRAIRAVVQDTEIATAQGIRAEWIYPLGLGLGIGLAAIAGALMAPLFAVSAFVGGTPLLKAFIVVILGGLGSIPGAALASLLLGVIESLTITFFSSSTADILQLALVMLILVFRPSGLLGTKES